MYYTIESDHKRVNCINKLAKLSCSDLSELNFISGSRVSGYSEIPYQRCLALDLAVSISMSRVSPFCSIMFFI